MSAGGRCAVSAPGVLREPWPPWSPAGSTDPCAADAKGSACAPQPLVCGHCRRSRSERPVGVPRSGVTDSCVCVFVYRVRLHLCIAWRIQGFARLCVLRVRIFPPTCVRGALVHVNRGGFELRSWPPPLAGVDGCVPQWLHVGGQVWGGSLGGGSPEGWAGRGKGNRSRFGRSRLHIARTRMGIGGNSVVRARGAEGRPRRARPGRLETSKFGSLVASCASGIDVRSSRSSTADPGRVWTDRLGGSPKKHPSFSRVPPTCAALGSAEALACARPSL